MPNSTRREFLAAVLTPACIFGALSTSSEASNIREERKKQGGPDTLYGNDVLTAVFAEGLWSAGLGATFGVVGYWFDQP